MLRWHLTGGMVAALNAISRWMVVSERACVVTSRKAQLWVTRNGVPTGEFADGFEIELPEECDTLDIWQDDDGVHVCTDGLDCVYMPKRTTVAKHGKAMPSAWLAAFAQEAIKPHVTEIVMEREPLRFEFRGG